MNNKKVISLLPYILVISIMVLLITFGNGSNTKEFNYNEFAAQAENLSFKEVNMSMGTTVIGVRGTYQNGDSTKSFTVSVPRTDDNVKWLSELFEKNKKTKVNVLDANKESVLEVFLKSVLPFLILGGAAIFLFSRMNAGGNNKAFEFSKSRAKIESSIKVRFKDVAGCDEEKEEVKEIIDYLKDPKRFTDMGARIPKGMLMVGPPGTGKTLLAKAFLFSRMNAGGNNKAFEFSKSRAKIESSIKVRFKDVAGCDEEKEEVKEIIDYLKDPKRFTDMGARIPKGMLMVGPPGTGKTLLAKAVAGEADVPFFSISGSDFVEMFVGTGASRVRDMFKKAQQHAPCIVFIDEIDAVGRQRGAGMGGGNDEREQTLNQLLVEMDGMGENKGIVIIAATNRPDVLDPALLRSGRFDRQITVNLPDKKGRYEILKVHARNKKLAKDISLESLAKRTPGFSGADLENVLNEGAILAVRDKRKMITMEDLDEAIDRVMMGPAKKSKKYTEKEKRLVAYHEAGHAVIGLKLEDADKVEKVTIIPRGEAGGYNLMTPKEEKLFPTKADFMSQITGLMGGRVAEEVMFNEISAGASNDIQKATKIAKAMVRSWGMSSLGPIQYDDGTGNVFLGRDYGSGSNYSGEIAYEIDKEIRKIINECYDQAKKLIEDNKDLLTLIAENLIEEETITSEQINNLMTYGKLTSPEQEQRKEQARIEAEREEERSAQAQAEAENPTQEAEDNETSLKREEEKQKAQKSFEEALKELTKHDSEE